MICKLWVLTKGFGLFILDLMGFEGVLEDLKNWSFGEQKVTKNLRLIWHE